jgi:hypothetical protein
VFSLISSGVEGSWISLSSGASFIVFIDIYIQVNPSGSLLVFSFSALLLVATAAAAVDISICCYGSWFFLCGVDSEFLLLPCIDLDFVLGITVMEARTLWIQLVWSSDICNL